MNYLVLIYVDLFFCYDNMKGVFVWVFFNCWVNDEMGLLLEESEKKLEFLGGVGWILVYNNECYLN